MSLPTIRSRRASRWTLVVALTLAPLAACDDGGTEPDAGAEVTVMSRNVYLGADIFQLADAGNAQELVLVAGQLFAQVEATDFTERAGALAAEIEAADPALVGLQEVSLYRIQQESDFQTYPLPNAEEVAYDFLQLLMSALEERGLDYRVAAELRNADAELPALLDPLNPTGLSDIRLTDRDVILARGDVDTENPIWTNYETAALLPAGGFDVPFPRGWMAVDATVDGASFTFLNTHVEGLMPAHEAQAAELVDVVDEIDGPLILVGDLNTRADLTGTPGYGLLVVDGPLNDAYAEVGASPGYTCCFPADLRSDTRSLDERIDFVLHRGDLEPVSARVVGGDPAGKTPSGLWPSDHGGVVATFEID